MADAVEEVPQASISASKKRVGRQNKKQKVVSNHPKVSEMVNSAILNLKERNGSSLQAIKKYITATYKVDVDKLASFIRKYLKSAVSNGTLIQTKGKGASGSFKLGGTMKSDKSEVKTPKSPPAKAKASKPAPAKPKIAKEKTKAKSPKKSTKEKVRKTPTKAKAPKPKKAPSKSAKPPTKAAPKQETSGETEQNVVILD